MEKKCIGYFGITLLSLFLLSCSTKIVSFKVNTGNGNIKYRLAIPKGYEYIPMDYQHVRGKVFLYPDSSSIFFTNDIKSGAIYPEKFKKYGSDIGMKFLTNDTLTLNGVDEKGLYWEERKIKNIVYGYMRVPPSKKDIFDKILDSITK